MKITDFDKIWCLSACDNERLSNSKREFEKLGWDVQYYFNPQNPLVKTHDKTYCNVMDYKNTYEKRGKDEKLLNMVLSCFIGHYNIIKASYMLGYEKILIAEDDFKLKDGVDFDLILEQVPDDFDMLNFYDSLNSQKYKKYNNENDFWKEFNGPIRCCGAVLYAMKRNLMEFYLNWYQTHPAEPSDFFYNVITSLTKWKLYVNSYVALDHKNHQSIIWGDRLIEITPPVIQAKNNKLIVNQIKRNVQNRKG